MPIPDGDFEQYSHRQYNGENTIFALDIGTRTVIGVVAAVEGVRLKILAQSITEHESRAVFDGQIHDIFMTARAVKRVKNDLEEKLGFKLKRVAIAAAGRSLLTRFAHMEKETEEDIEIDPMICRGLEIDAVREAHASLRDENVRDGEEEFYCVGYTVVNYYLNGYTITNLVGHSGKRIGVDVLATFLPNSVVNSLYAVLGRVNLESVSLTLEPIAASTAIIPESYRLLNLALVDIGAGTSDIAITRDGSVVAYGMVPMAGDEITEALAQSCLADFNTADQIKREIVRGGDITFKDIMGIERTISNREALEMLDPVLDSLSDRITGEILKLNGNKPVKSVFCVGGGGQVPTLTDRIAAKLGLSPDRVGLRERKLIPGLEGGDGEIDGPEGVTVVGIAQVALKSVGHNFIVLNINGKDYRLFHSRALTVFDALGLIEYNLGDLVGKNGKDLRFILNGERKIIYGELCKPAEVFVNGEAASLKAELADGDRVMIEKAVRGRDARALIRDFAGEVPTFVLCLAEREETVQPQCFINGKPVSLDQEITDGDRVEIRAVKTVSQLAELKNIDIGRYDVFINGQIISGDAGLAGGDRVEFRPKGMPEQAAGASPDTGEPAALKRIEVTVNGEKVVLDHKSDYIFVDIFNNFEIDLSMPATGGMVKLRLNGQDAGYTDPIKNGDVIRIGWE